VPITSQLHIQFDHIHIKIEGARKRGSGVLGRRSRGTTVGDSHPRHRHAFGIGNSGHGVKRCAGSVRVAGLLSVCHTSSVTETWTELTITVPQQHGEAIANFLMDRGSPGLQYADDGDAVRVTAYFSNDPPLDALRRYCVDLGCAADESGGPDIGSRMVADEDWAHSWMIHSEPQVVGERLYICPSWAAAAPSGRTAIIIDPGMAFGTGQHATTQGCLQQLERVIVGGSITRALDVGTGSGVLAIALAKLGVDEVWAVDTDPVACRVATANASVNGVGTRVRVTSDLADVPGSFDLIVANLFADLLEVLARQLVERLKADGTLIVSGLLGVDEARVLTAYEAVGLAGARRQFEEPWVTLVLARA